MIKATTRPAYLLGNPIVHSKSPLMQNAALSYHAIDSVYLALNIEREDFDRVAAGLKRLDILGMNITLPYKKAIMGFVDQLSEEAAEIDAVNTVVIDEGRWIGHNTDWYGVYKTLENREVAREHKVLIIGAGGASNGTVYGLKKYGFEDIAITNRTMEKAEAVASIMDIETLDFSRLDSALDSYSLIVNSTTLPFDKLLKSIDPDKVYFDLKYYSGSLDIPNFIDGSEMLLYQGARSFELWTGKKAPIDIMREALGE